MSEDTESGLGVLQLVKMHAAGQISLELFWQLAANVVGYHEELPIVADEPPAAETYGGSHAAGAASSSMQLVLLHRPRSSRTLPSMASAAATTRMWMGRSRQRTIRRKNSDEENEDAEEEPGCQEASRGCSRGGSAGGTAARGRRQKARASKDR